MFELAGRTIRVALAAATVTAGAATIGVVDAAAQETPAVVGDWEGALSAMGQELTVVFHITQGEDGSLAATLDSPDQGAFGIACEAPVVEEGSVTIPVAAVQGEYVGTISEDGSTIEGTWTQGPNSLPLILKQVTAEAEG